MIIRILINKVKYYLKTALIIFLIFILCYTCYTFDMYIMLCYIFILYYIIYIYKSYLRYSIILQMQQQYNRIRAIYEIIIECNDLLSDRLFRKYFYS